MLQTLRDLAINLLASFIFAMLAHLYQKARNRTEPAAAEPSAPGSGDRHVSILAADSAEFASARRFRDDLGSFGILVAASVTVCVPFLLGAGLLAVADSLIDNSELITEQMRREGGDGYVQYWLGFSLICAAEICYLLFRPWRGRVFGVVLGIALALFLVYFSFPASRGASLF
ncbi:hypothetical protein AB0I28_12000 [Phytomonospora sp. NPDC050363]|uniref:hypothetical protein n=1 Tax=Phytomonospora sp. NPDC050363 TaxID=3155642 RepID=UPI0033D784BC